MLRIEQAKILISEINSAEELRWKVIRKALVDLEILGGYRILGYKTFSDFCLGEFNKKHHFYSQELSSATIELLIGVPLNTFPSITLRSLKQWRIKHSTAQLKVIDEYKSVYTGKQFAACSLGNATKIREVWFKISILANERGLELPTYSEIQEVIAKLHQENPADVKKPALKNGVEMYRVRYTEVKAKNEKLTAELEKTKTLYETIASTTTTSDLESIESLSSLKLANKMLSDKLQRQTTINQNLLARCKLLEQQVESFRRSRAAAVAS